MTTTTAPAASKTEYVPFLRPLAVNGYAVIIATGKAGQITGKAKWEGKTVWGIAWASEYPASQLARLTPAEFHALPESHKISKENWGEEIRISNPFPLLPTLE